MIFLAYLILATIFYTLFDIFASRAGARIDNDLSAVIFNAIGAAIPLVIYFVYKAAKGSSQLIPTTKSGVWYSILAGISIAIFSILLIKVFEKGGLSYVTPVIYGGTVVLASVIGWTVFKESTSPLYIAGFCFTVIGLMLIVVAKYRLSI